MGIIEMIKGNNNAIKDTPDAEIEALFAEVQTNYMTFKTHDMNFRKTMLKSLKKGLQVLEEEIIEAVHADLGQPPVDAYASNIMPVMAELDVAIQNIDSWVKPKHVKGPLLMFPGSMSIKQEPLGVVLVMGSWNYPFSTMGSVVSAIAAGNAVIMKPSEHSVHCSNAFQKLMDTYLDLRFYKTIPGAVDTAVKLTSLPFNKICFTGSTFVGKLVAQAASKNLVPCCLELGGKCPVLVDQSADLQLAARRIVSTKFLNAGQTCVAPDYIFIHSAIKSKFIELVKMEIEKQFGINPKNSSTYSRLIHPLHTQRVADMLKGSESKIIHGSMEDIEVNGRFIPPIIVDEPEKDSPLMTEEIFGPILPIISYYKPKEDVIDHINSQGHPLAVYYYGEPSSVICQRLQEMTRSGSFMTNDCTLQFVALCLPFGGVGDSGYGATKGKHGFDSMSHGRSYIIRPNSRFLDLSARYANSKDSVDRLKRMKMMHNLLYYSIDDFKNIFWIMVVLAVLGALFYFRILEVNLPFGVFN